jgi:hypothetical protein
MGNRGVKSEAVDRTRQRKSAVSGYVMQAADRQEGQVCARKTSVPASPPMNCSSGLDPLGQCSIPHVVTLKESLLASAPLVSRLAVSRVTRTHCCPTMRGRSVHAGVWPILLGGAVTAGPGSLSAQQLSSVPQRSQRLPAPSSPFPAPLFGKGPGPMAWAAALAKPEFQRDLR